MEALLFIGLPGAGKSTFWKQRFFDTHLRINRDQLRTEPRERALIATCLNSRIRFALDNTSSTRAGRAPIIERATNAKFRIHAFYFEPDYEACLQRNARRRGKARVPVAAIGYIAKQLQKPGFDEGFSSIFSVWNQGAHGFRVEEWTNEI